MTRRPKVLLLNNYPMADAMRGWRDGAYPGHHLWGAAGLREHGFDVVIPPWAGIPRIAAFLKPRVPVEWGDCDQQLRAALRLDCDVIYSACQYASGLLARLRTRGLLRKPVVALVHHALGTDEPTRAFVAGHTRLPCLSGRVRDQLRGTFAVPEERARLLDWGPELRFYDALPDGPPDAPGALVVSAGKSFRDHDTLATAAAEEGIATLVVGTAPARAPASPFVRVNAVGEGCPNVPYPEVLRLCRAARVLAIPLLDTSGLAGLTSLLDALALGKPVVMTRNPWVDLDVAAEGIGLWVDPGDVAGWRRALRELSSDEARCREMGARARALAEKRYNLDAFTAQLARELSAALADRRPIGRR
jgi:glycosyltransferase involved in cell wall biosynthesis